MKPTLERKVSVRKAQSPDVIGRIEAVVIDERRKPVERVAGMEVTEASAHELSLSAELPLIPGSHLLVQIGDRHSPGAAGRRFEVEVVGCKKWMRRHEVRTRLVEGTMPRELLRAA